MDMATAVKKRDQKARRAGFADWTDFVRGTTGLTQPQAARLLGVSSGSVKNWRAELGVQPPWRHEDRAEAFRSNLGDRRHGTDNGYRNFGCRCRPCTTAWVDYLRARRDAARATTNEERTS